MPDASIPPVASPNVPQINTVPPQVEAAQKSSRTFNSIAALLVIVVLGIASAALIIKATTKTPPPLVTSSQPSSSETIPELQASYANPFDKETQYENPFTEEQNPFDNLAE